MMKVEQIYTGCLAEAAYYIESKGEAVIIDPLRETAPYIERAEADGAKIKYVLLTHFHADFVSGHVDLAKKTGATIVYGPSAKADFDLHEAKDGEILEIGDVKLKVLHTPGHTMESTTYLLIDENGKEHSIYTGDTLFIGDVGRPDLAVKSGSITEEDLARHLYKSLRNKIMVLNDDVIVYPGHGAGSACGKNMSKETFDTLGHQKEVNYALRADMTEDEFVKEVLEGLTKPPQYFPMNVKMNKSINPEIDEVISKGLVALKPKELETLVEDGALLLDVRTQNDFVEEHIPGSIFIGLNGAFAPWVGALIPDIHQRIVLVAPEGKEEEAVIRLSRIGYDNSIGFLKGGLETWKAEGGEVDSIKKITAQEFEAAVKEGGINVLDVRKTSEYEAHHMEGVQNVPLDYVNERFSEIDPNKTYYVHCLGGYRSVIFESILKARGYHNLIDIDGGFRAIEQNTDIELTNFTCSSKG